VKARGFFKETSRRTFVNCKKRTFSTSSYCLCRLECKNIRSASIFGESSAARKFGGEDSVS